MPSSRSQTALSSLARLFKLPLLDPLLWERYQRVWCTDFSPRKPQSRSPSAPPSSKQQRTVQPRAFVKQAHAVPRCGDCPDIFENPQGLNMNLEVLSVKKLTVACQRLFRNKENISSWKSLEETPIIKMLPQTSSVVKQLLFTHVL